MPINFDVSPEEKEKIIFIAERAEELELISKHRDKVDVMMDITAAHMNGCPLDLDCLITAPDFDFTHDVCGIANHISHETGELLDCFLPRCARRDI